MRIIVCFLTIPLNSKACYNFCYAGWIHDCFAMSSGSVNLDKARSSGRQRHRKLHVIATAHPAAAAAAGNIRTWNSLTQISKQNKMKWSNLETLNFVEVYHTYLDNRETDFTRGAAKVLFDFQWSRSDFLNLSVSGWIIFMVFIKHALKFTFLARKPRMARGFSFSYIYIDNFFSTLTYSMTLQRNNFTVVRLVNQRNGACHTT